MNQHAKKLSIEKIIDVKIKDKPQKVSCLFHGIDIEEHRYYYVGALFREVDEQGNMTSILGAWNLPINVIFTDANDRDNFMQTCLGEMREELIEGFFDGFCQHIKFLVESELTIDVSEGVNFAG